MKIKSIVFTAIIACLIIPFNASAHQPNAGEHLILNLVGKGYMYLMNVPDYDDAMCFDANLVDANNNNVIGTATDCLSEVMDGPNGGLQLIGTTIFHLPGGTLMTRGNTTVQPVNHSITTAPHKQVITHITGAAGYGNAVIKGTGRFAGATGTVRLSGMVNLSEFGDDVDQGEPGLEGDPITFDCLFNINLD